MRRSQKLTLANEGADDSIKRKALVLQKGQGMLGYRCKFTVPIKNTTGGILTLAAGDKTALLKTFLADLAVGPEGHARTPYHNCGFDRIRNLARSGFWQENDYYSDTAIGLGKNCAANATTPVVFHALVPTFQIQALPELFNVMCAGKSQAQLMELKITRQASSAPQAFVTAGLSIDPALAVTVEVFPEIVPLKVDRWVHIPEWNETHLRKQSETYADMLWILLVETSTAHANTTLTKVNVAIEGQEVQRDMAPADMITPFTGFANLPTAARLDLDWTLLHWIQPGTLLRNVLTGHLAFEQPNNDMPDMALGLYGIPVPQKADVDAILSAISKDVRSANIHAVNAFAADGLDFEDHVSAFQPINIYGPGEAGYEKYAGLRVIAGGAPAVVIPSDVQSKVGGAIKVHKANKKDAAAKDLVNKAARFVPCAATTGTGFDNGGPYYDQVKALVGA